MHVRPKPKAEGGGGVGAAAPPQRAIDLGQKTQSGGFNETGKVGESDAFSALPKITGNSRWWRVRAESKKQPSQ